MPVSQLMLMRTVSQTGERDRELGELVMPVSQLMLMRTVSQTGERMGSGDHPARGC
jgi:hypothetical protein